jgi:hypothetical protein
LHDVSLMRYQVFKMFCECYMMFHRWEIPSFQKCLCECYIICFMEKSLSLNVYMNVSWKAERYIKLSKCLSECYMIFYGRFIKLSKCLSKCCMMFHWWDIKFSKCSCECYLFIYFFTLCFEEESLTLSKYKNVYINVT